MTGCSWDDVRGFCVDLPGAEEGTSYATPAFKVKKKLFARFHQDGESLVVRVEPDERELLMDANPAAFYITDHYLDHPWMLVRLAVVDAESLHDLLESSWRLSAPPKLVADYDGE